MRELERLRRLSRELIVLAFTSSRRSTQDQWITDRMLRSLDERHVPAGTTVYEEGELPGWLHFMADGALRMTRPGATPWTMAGRWVFGAQEILAARPYRWTATAEGPIDLVTVAADDWLELVEDSFEIAREMLSSMARALTGLHERLPPDGGFGPPAVASEPPPHPPLSILERTLALGAVPSQRGGGMQPLVNLAESAEEVEFAPGETLFARGALRERVFIIVDGLVELTHEEPAIRARFGPGQVAGASVAFGDAAHTWESRALEPTRALAIRIEDWAAQIEEQFDFFRSGITALGDEREEVITQLAARSGALVLR